MADQWVSKGLYEHPAKHQSGTYGNIVLSQAGVYGLRVGGSHMSCPQGWAAKIHNKEVIENEERTKKVVVEVLGGVAEVTKCPKGVTVEIIDHDNEKTG